MRENTTNVIKRVIADLTHVNASIVQTAITALAIAMGANEVWEFDLKLRVQGKAVADIDSSLTGPAGSVLSYGAIEVAAKDAVGAEEILNALVDDLPTIVHIEGVIVTGATPGNLQALAAQNVSNASDLFVLAGSSLKAKRIDDTV